MRRSRRAFSWFGAGLDMRRLATPRAAHWLVDWPEAVCPADHRRQHCTCGRCEWEMTSPSWPLQRRCPPQAAAISWPSRWVVIAPLMAEIITIQTLLAILTNAGHDNTSGSVSRVAEHNLQIFNHFSIYA